MIVSVYLHCFVVGVDKGPQRSLWTSWSGAEEKVVRVLGKGWRWDLPRMQLVHGLFRYGSLGIPFTKPFFVK